MAVFIGSEGPKDVSRARNGGDVKSLANVPRDRELVQFVRRGFAMSITKHSDRDQVDQNALYVDVPKYIRGVNMARLNAEANVVDGLLASLLGAPVSIHVSSSGSQVYIEGFPLPGDYSSSSTDVLIRLPSDYPATPPAKVYVDNGLTRGGRPLKDYHSNSITENGKSWAWWCMEQISSTERTWRPDWDGLHTFVPMLLASFQEADTR